MSNARPPRAERVLILMANAVNRSLLRSALADRYDVIDAIDDLDRDDPRGPFDLCIVDGSTLNRVRAQLTGLRARFAPLLLPVLALTDRRDVGLMTRELWSVADDVLVRPLERPELAARVQALLRMRAMSLQLDRLADRLEHERRIAQLLQDGALPKAVPEIPGLVIDAFYRPGSNDANVGGDWYDAIRLPNGLVVVSIGDVAGSGLDAAVTMANMRQVLRGLAYVHSDPAMMLDAADRVLTGSDAERIVTVFACTYDAIGGELRYASAGHPWPFVRREDGTVQQLVNRGTPLGIGTRHPRSTDVAALGVGDVLVLYTDGLTEAGRDLIAAEERLAAFVGSDGVFAQGSARAAYASVVIGEVHDDVAIATVQIVSQSAEARIARWTLDSGDVLAVREAREAISRALRDDGMSSEADNLAQLVLAELIGNVVRYAGGEMTIALDLATRAPVLHVFDRGPGFQHSARLPSDLLMESGRGLFIVAALTDEFTVQRRSGGGSHARAVLRTFSEAPAPRSGAPSPALHSFLA